MERLRLTLSFLALVLAAFFASSCGTNSSTLPCYANSQTPVLGQGQLQSITLTPATADPQTCPSGKVQFTATGNYTDPSQTVTPQKILAWGVCQQGLPTSEVSVTSNGVAKCASGANGTYTIWADYGSITCNVTTPCGPACGTIAGTAQLTCP
jgi:hypothetical protein